MGRNKIDRTGEINYNTFGSKMIIIKYRKYSDIDIYFPEYDWTFKNSAYKEFKKGNIACPYEKRVYGVGYLGEGKYKAYENDINYELLATKSEGKSGAFISTICNYAGMLAVDKGFQKVNQEHLEQTIDKMLRDNKSEENNNVIGFMR